MTPLPRSTKYLCMNPSYACAATPTLPCCVCQVNVCEQHGRWLLAEHATYPLPRDFAVVFPRVEPRGSVWACRHCADRLERQPEHGQRAERQQ